MNLWNRSGDAGAGRSAVPFFRQAAGIWVPGAAVTLWSHFSWETVPNWWRGIGEWLSFNLNSRQEREAFTRLIVILNVVTAGALLLLLAIQGAVIAKERNRIRGIDPSIVE
ncbi:MAG TPA: hypothetical protein VM492_16450 [Sumerlaeia bacterium]|nr:hypothetical protein [Sumerlaeia bacterium]